MKQTTPERLNKDDILTTEARRTLFKSLMQGLSLTEAAKKANLKPQTAHLYSRQFKLSALVRQEKAVIEAKTAKMLHITREGQAKKFEKVIDAGHENGQLSAVNGAIRGQNELCGLVRDKDTDMAKISLAAALTALARSQGRQIAPTGQEQPLIEATTDETE